MTRMQELDLLIAAENRTHRGRKPNTSTPAASTVRVRLHRAKKAARREYRRDHKVTAPPSAERRAIYLAETGRIA